MPNIFISYRRDDAEAEARLLANALKTRFGRESVFFDRADIAPGARYPKVLRDQLSSSDVLVAVVGRDWVKSRDGARRLEDENDWVRHEVAVGLQRGIRVVPVLVKGASPPLEADLPAPVRELASCQALSARGESWDSDVSGLIEQLSPLDASRKSLARGDVPGLTPYSGEEWRDELKPLLERVKTIYVDGVLASVQRDVSSIRIETEDVPEAVEHMAGRTVEITNRPRETISRGVALIQTYDRTAGSLLVLGEPGCGKTIAMLELARDLVERAEGNTGAPVPVVFRLSGWAQKQGEFLEWLLGELQIRYQVPRRVGRKLLELRRLVLLLDGLDEVGVPAQAACVNAINGHLERCGAAGVAVTCRYREYTMMSVRLRLFGAIFIRPLSQADVESYLEEGGSELAPLLNAVKSDEALLSMAQIPLFLLLMTVAFRRMKSAPEASAITGLSTHDLKSAICDRYIEARLAPPVSPQDRLESTATKGAGVAFAPTHSTSWYMPMLVWLATAMRRTGQTECHIEFLQPAWLARTERGVWFLFSRIAAFVVFAGMIAAADLSFQALVEEAAEFRRGQEYFLSQLAPSVAVGLATAVYVGVLGFAGALGPKSTWVKRISVTASVALAYVSLLVLAMRASSWVGHWDPISGPYGPLFLMLYLLRVLRPKVQDEIAGAERLSWSWRHALRRGSIAIVIGGFLTGLLWMELPKAQDSLRTAEQNLGAQIAHGIVVAAIIQALLGVVLVTLAAVSFSGVTTAIVQGKTRANEGILLSLRNALLAWLFTVLWCVPIAYTLLAVEGMFEGGGRLPKLAEVRWLLWVLPSTAAFVAFNLGGVDVMHHYALRVLLAIRGYVPLRFAGFLDHGVEVGFLRRVGGGYTFLHRILLDHLATLASAHQRQ